MDQTHNPQDQNQSPTEDTTVLTQLDELDELADALDANQEPKDILIERLRLQLDQLRLQLERERGKAQAELDRERARLVQAKDDYFAHQRIIAELKQQLQQTKQEALEAQRRKEDLHRDQLVLEQQKAERASIGWQERLSHAQREQDLLKQQVMGANTVINTLRAENSQIKSQPPKGGCKSMFIGALIGAVIMLIIICGTMSTMMTHLSQFGGH